MSHEPASDGSEDVFASLRAELIRDCTEAIAHRGTGPDGRIPSEPRPEGCELLSDQEYLDAYLEGIRQANEAARQAIWKRAQGGYP